MYVPYQDEISLNDIVVKLRKRRGILLALPVLSLLAAIAFLIFSAVRTEQPTIYFVRLQGIDKSMYPNGTPFTPPGFIAPGGSRSGGEIPWD